MIKSELKLGEVLKKQGLISETSLHQALEEQHRIGGKLGEILVKQGKVKEKDIALALSKQLGIMLATIEQGHLRPNLHQNLEKLIPESFAIEHHVLPLSLHMHALTVAMVDPLDLMTIDDVAKMTSCDITTVVTTATEMKTAIDGFYKSKEIIKKTIQEKFVTLDKEAITRDQEVDAREIFSEAEGAPIVKFVDLILMEAVEQGASDIHIEHFESRVGIRYRVDGVLYEVNPPDIKMYFAIISRIKILSKMDIAERRLPQEGGFTISYADKFIDVRTSSIPTVFGEKLVMRLLDKTKLPLEFDILGFEQYEIKLLEKEIKKPYGMVFVTGPTGSGKSTTLYTILNFLKSPKKNIITVEDPVEYKLDGINQVQVKPLIGLTFASALRSFLRQDPDIMMVGEVRDLETAQMCIRAALTGHLVLSTLHTNDSAQAVTRIMDIGIEPFLLVSCLNMVIAQRLCRRLCDECKEEVEPDICLKDLKINTPIYKAKGCEKCRFTGYRGRIGFYEVLQINEEIRSMIYYRKSADEIRTRAKELGLRSLYEFGLEKMKQGLTSFEEVLAVTVSE